jgi:hypothetical protein
MSQDCQNEISSLRHPKESARSAIDALKEEGSGILGGLVVSVLGRPPEPQDTKTPNQVRHLRSALNSGIE